MKYNDNTLLHYITHIIILIKKLLFIMIFFPRLIMNAGQRAAMNYARDGHCIFICGQAGTGKSFTLYAIFKHMQGMGKRRAMTCSTGVACTYFSNDVGATTIHRYAIYTVYYRFASLNGQSYMCRIGNMRLVKFCIFS